METADIIRALVQVVLAVAVGIAFLYLVFERILGATEVLPIVTLTFGFFFGRKTAK